MLIYQILLYLLPKWTLSQVIPVCNLHDVTKEIDELKNLNINKFKASLAFSLIGTLWSFQHTCSTCNLCYILYETMENYAIVHVSFQKPNSISYNVQIIGTSHFQNILNNLLLTLHLFLDISLQTSMKIPRKNNRLFLVRFFITISSDQASLWCNN